MNDFDYIAPTRIIFGKEKETQIGAILKAYGYKKILLHYGQNSIKTTGLYQKIVTSLNNNNIEFIEMSGVRPNPTLALVEQAISLINSNPVDMILAVGGGSVIDSAKLIATGYYYPGNPFDFFTGKAKPLKAIDVGVVLTIAAAGSETSASCVISDDESKSKRGFTSDFNRPKFVVMNPELSYSVDPYQTACGIVDILMHTLERYFNFSLENELADEISVGILRSVIQAGKEVMNNPHDYEARATLMLASTLSHNGITSLGKKAYMPVHQLEHAVSGEYDFVAHGAGLAVLFPAWAEHYLTNDVAKFAKFARKVMNVELENDLESAKLGILLLSKYFIELKMPRNFQELKIENPNIEVLVNKVTNNKTQSVWHHLEVLDANVAAIIFNKCL